MKRTILKVATAWGLLFLYLVVTQPERLPLVGLIVPYILLFIALYSTGTLLASLRERYKNSSSEPRGRPQRLSMVVSLIIVLLLTLQSIGQLSVRDVITTLAIFALGYLYFARSSFGPER